jgi:hypothetical protein
MVSWPGYFSYLYLSLGLMITVDTDAILEKLTASRSTILLCRYELISSHQIGSQTETVPEQREGKLRPQFSITLIGFDRRGSFTPARVYATIEACCTLHAARSSMYGDVWKPAPMQCSKHISHMRMRPARASIVAFDIPVSRSS